MYTKMKHSIKSSPPHLPSKEREDSPISPNFQKMNTVQYIRALKKQNIFVHVRDGELKVKANKEALTKEVLTSIKARKEDLLIFYQSFNGEATYRSIAKAEPKPYYVTSSAQRRLHFMNELNASSLAYNMPQVMRLDGVLDEGRLRKAFAGLIERHEGLRTSFRRVGPQVVQVVHEQVDFELECYQAAEDEAPSVVGAFVRPFDLGKAPLIRVGLVQLSASSHLLMLDVHHIVNDWQSDKILINDIVSLYQEQDLPALPLQYKDYAEWQQSEEQQKRITKQRDFWKKEFAQEVEVLDLPYDYPRPAAKNFEGDSKAFALSKEATAGLWRLEQETGTTMFMTILSIYNILLSKLGGQEDIVVGTPVTGRNHADLEEAVGMFVYTIAIRNAVDKTLSFREFLSRVKEKTLSCLDNQMYPHEELIGELRIPRDASRNPLFSVMFVLEPMEESEEVTIPGLNIEGYDSGHKISKFDLTLRARVSKDEILLTYEYSTELFSEQTIEKFTTYLQQIIKEVTTDSTKRIAEINMLPVEEQQQLINDFNDTATDYPQDKTVVDIFEVQVEKNPDRVALILEEEAMSYQAFSQRVDQLANVLISQGVQQGDIIGLMCDRSFEMMVGVYGIMKAGAAYLPIDPTYPDARIAYIVEDSGVNLIAGSLKTQEKVPRGTNYLALNSLPGPQSLGEQKVSSRAEPEGLAYVIYTSGSTGNPKGVMIEHRSLMNRLHWMGTSYPIGANDVVLQKTPIVFDVSVWELFWWSQQGATLCLLTPGGEKDPYLMSSKIEQCKVTTMHFVPSMLRVFLDYVEGLEAPSTLQSLRQVFSSGEALAVDQVKRFRRLLQATNQTRLINLYGPTEATIDVTHYNCDVALDSLIPIGKPISNTSMYILDTANRLQPMGVPGELCIGGVGLARGYLNNEPLTKEKFIDHPFREGERLYKTGDLARWLPNGNIEFLGRIDHQVKLRGYRIELGEIEKALSNHEVIKDAVVLVKEQEDDKYLVGYYVAEAVLSTQVLRDYLSRQLPEYMIPNYFVHLDTMPLTTSGKINKKALPDPDCDQYLKELEESPRNAIELQLVEVWKQVLRLKSLGINNNFFRLGGHSLTAITLINAINRKLGLALPTKVIFERQTVKEMCAEIQRMESFKGDFEVGIIKKVMKPKIAHLSYKPDLPYLFFAAPLGGILPPTSMVGIVDMVDGLKDTVSFVSLQTPPLMPELLDQIERGDQVELSPNLSDQTIRRLAIEMAENILKVQNTSSYYLGGFCTGSVLTLEVAKELVKQGKRIEKLILVDPSVWVETMAGRIVDVNYSTDAVAKFVAYDLGWDTPEMNIAYLKEMMAHCPMDKIWKICEDYMKTLNMFDRQFDESEVKKSFERKFYNDLALQFYFVNQPFQYPTLNVEDTLILATKESFTELKQVAQSKFTGRFAVELIEASHHDLFQPGFLKQWNGRIRNHLQKESV